MKHISRIVVALSLLIITFLIVRSCEKGEGETIIQPTTTSTSEQVREWLKGLQEQEITYTLRDMDMTFPGQKLKFKHPGKVKSFLCGNIDLNSDIAINVEIGYKSEDLWKDTKIVTLSDTLLHVKVKTGFPIIVDTTLAYGTEVDVTGNWWKQNVGTSIACTDQTQLDSLENNLILSSKTAIVRDIESEIIGTFWQYQEEYAESIAKRMRGFDRLTFDKVKVDFEFNSTVNYKYMRKLQDNDEKIEYSPIIIKQSVTVD